MPIESTDDLRSLVLSLREFMGEQDAPPPQAASSELTEPRQVERMLSGLLVEFFGMQVQGL